MTNQKISQMTPASALTGSESLPVVQGGASRRVSVRDVVDAGYQVFNVKAYGAVGNNFADDTAAGATTYLLTTQYQKVTLISNGTNWGIY